MPRNYPVCPYCHKVLVRAHVQDEEGAWVVHWVCACKADPSIVRAMEQRLATLAAAGITV